MPDMAIPHYALTADAYEVRLETARGAVEGVCAPEFEGDRPVKSLWRTGRPASYAGDAA